jgi:hypothetical protein
VGCSLRAHPIHISQRSLATYHNEKEPYDPDADRTPRKKYIFGGALLIAATAAILSSTSKKVKAEAHDSEYKSMCVALEFFGETRLMLNVNRYRG